MQRNFDPMRQQVESWRVQQLSGEVARLTIYRAFIEGKLDVPKHLARSMHDLYFYPQHEEICTAYDVAPVECIYVSIQRTGPGSAIQGDCEIG
jgi:hypothetical protein